MRNLILRDLKSSPGLNVGLVLSAKFVKHLGEENEKIDIFPVRAKTTRFFLGDVENIRNIIREKFDFIRQRIEVLGNEESGWILLAITCIDVEISHLKI